VVWQGSAGNRRPYADQTVFSDNGERKRRPRLDHPREAAKASANLSPTSAAEVVAE
jgi:hypothetical protein